MTSFPHSMKHFSDKLLAALDACGAPVCVGLDPQLDRIPRLLYEQSRASYGADRDVMIEMVAAFCLPVLEILRECGIRVVKPQIAFYEALGPMGLALYEHLCERAHELEMLVIADIKRADIGSTTAAYAAAWLGGIHTAGLRSRPFTVDAITVNPYLGSDGVLPFVEAAQSTGRGVFSLVRTSNSGSAAVQELPLASGKPLYVEIARLTHEWGQSCLGEAGYSDLGAVVGATQPEAARELRALMPQSIFLVPGYGAQGGKAGDLAPFFNEDGRGALVNSSRGVIHAYGNRDFDGDWKAEIARAALGLINDVGGVFAR